MKIVLLEPLNVPAEKIEQLAKPLKDQGHEFVYYNDKTTDLDDLASRSEGADIVMIANNPYPAEIIDKNDQLKFIDVAFTGIDHVGIDEARRADEIVVSNAAGYADQAVAELVIGLVLDLYRHISQGDVDIRKSEFPGPIQGQEIKGKTVGIVGTGAIGLNTAKLFKAFGARLIGYNRSDKPEARALGIEMMSLDELLGQADIVSLHVPVTEQTRGLIGADELKRMKESAILINGARGPVIDNDALAQALDNDEIAGAGLDVFDTEPPLPADYKILQAKNAILTPHIGFLTDEAMSLRAQIAFDNVTAFLNDNPQNVMN